MCIRRHLLVASCLATLLCLNRTGGYTSAAAVAAAAAVTSAATECAEPSAAVLSSMLLAAAATGVPNPSTGTLTRDSVANTSVLPGELQTCNDLKSVSGYSPFRQRALCPWYLVNETKANRYPRTLTAARSVNVTGCGKCPAERSCQGVKAEQTVLRNTGKCEGAVKVYAPVKENVTVGFACVLNSAGN